MENVPILSILRPQTARRFRNKLKRIDGCLVFTGAHHKQGYGVVEVMHEGVRYPILTHRLTWALEHGEDPPIDLMVCHHCNNPPCCLPKHLYIGTAQDNADDKTRAGRAHSGMLGCRGVNHPRARPIEDRERILAMIREDILQGKGLNALDIYRRTGVHDQTVRRWWKEAGGR